MFNYISGEIYRIVHKKSMYVYFACFAAGYCLLTFIIRSGNNVNGMMLDAENLFGLLPAIVGGYFFAAIFTDDMVSKNLTTLIGFGISRVKIVLSKLILTVLFGGLILGLLPLFMSCVYAALGQPPTFDDVSGVYIFALHAFMLLFACTALSAIVIYGLQRTTFGMVTYLLLALGVVDQLINMLLSWEAIRSLFPELSSHTVFAVSDRVMMGILLHETIAPPLAEYVVYVVAAMVLSVFAFYKKELEF